MKKILVFIFLNLSLYSHELIMSVMNNNNNTITVIGESTGGEDVAGVMIRLESLLNGQVLFKERLSQNSNELTIFIPNEPYQIVLDGGPDGIIVKDGIAPIEGFKEKVNKLNSKLSTAQNTNKEWDLITIFFFTLCLILLGLAIYFSNKNTNKILNQLKQ